MDALLNKKFLEDIGVTLDDDTYAALSSHYEATLNERVIAEIVDELDQQQLVELGNLKDGSSDVLQQWLVTNVPQLDEIIEDEIAILLGEMAESSDKF